MTTAGVLTSLTLPTGITLDSTKRMRAVVMGNLAIIVNSPSENITVDRFGTVRLLCPPTPSAVMTLSNTNGGSLSGTFSVKATFIVKDDFGNLIAESPFSQAATSAAITTDYLKVLGVPVCPKTITGLARRLYRTTTGPGSTYFPWLDVDGNRATTINDDTSDASLQLVAAPTDLGQPPNFELITVWKNRLWGKSSETKDTVYYSAIERPFAISSTNAEVIPPANRDNRGITGFLSRKDELGIGRADSLHKITGSSSSNFTRSTVAENIGIWAPDSCQVISDVGYFLGNPFGVYSWGPGSVKSISNERVRAWFDTDTYFNRARFDQAIGSYYPDLNAYVLLLSAAGSTDLDRWIMYDIGTGAWWGPHKTGALTPTGTVTLRDGNDAPMFVLMGGDGKLYKPQSTKTDGSSTAIDYDLETNWFSGGSPTIFKTWLEPKVVTKIQSGGTLTITPKIGNLNASAGTAISHDMTLGQQSFRRLGDGNFAQFRIRENTAAQDAVLYGLELPFFEIGERV